MNDTTDLKHGAFIDGCGLLHVRIDADPKHLINASVWEDLGFTLHPYHNEAIRPITKPLNGKVYPERGWLIAANNKLREEYPDLPVPGGLIIEDRIYDPKEAARKLYDLYNMNIWDAFSGYLRNWKYYKYAKAIANLYEARGDVKRALFDLARAEWDRFDGFEYSDISAEYKRRENIRRAKGIQNTERAMEKAAQWQS